MKSRIRTLARRLEGSLHELRSIRDATDREFNGLPEAKRSADSGQDLVEASDRLTVAIEKITAATEYLKDASAS